MKEPIPSPRETGFTTTTDVPLYWCAFGPSAAPRLLVLHGGPGAHHDYLLPQFLDLADAFELLFYDQRGGGRSKTDDRTPITWQTHVRDLERVVAELELAPVTMVGYSWGAMLALLYAVEALHGRVSPAPSRLVLVDPAPLNGRARAEFDAEFSRRQLGPAIQALRDELVASGLRETDPTAYKQRVFELSVAAYFADPRRASDLTPFRVMARVQQSVWESLGARDVIEELGEIHLPTLVVHGQQDPIPIWSSVAAATMLAADFVPLDACGHVPYVEARAELFAALRSFLQRTADSGSV